MWTLPSIFFQTSMKPIEMISKYPRSGKEYEPQEKLERTYRIKLVKNCKLFYTSDDETKEIYIAYLFHDLQEVEVL